MREEQRMITIRKLIDGEIPYTKQIQKDLDLTLEELKWIMGELEVSMETNGFFLNELSEEK